MLENPGREVIVLEELAQEALGWENPCVFIDNDTRKIRIVSYGAQNIITFKLGTLSNMVELWCSAYDWLVAEILLNTVPSLKEEWDEGQDQMPRMP